MREKYKYINTLIQDMPRKVPGKVMIGVWISEDLNNSLRKILPAERGALSKFVEEAISEKLEREFKHR